MLLYCYLHELIAQTFILGFLCMFSLENIITLYVYPFLISRISYIDLRTTLNCM